MTYKQSLPSPYGERKTNTTYEAPRPASRDVVSSPLFGGAKSAEAEEKRIHPGAKHVPWSSAKADKKSHGGYRNLQSYQLATIIYDLTIEFVKRYIDYRSRTKDQMEQAARSGKQCIAEGSQFSGASKKMEIKLINSARASLEELLQDYEDFLRHRNLPLWDKDDPRARAVRALAYKSNKSYTTYKTYLSDPEQAANCLLTLIHQANFLLDHQLQSLEKTFIEQGGYTEELFRRRKERRKI